MLRSQIFDRLVSSVATVGALPRVRRQWMAAVIDAFLCVIAVWVAFSLRLGEWYLSTPSIRLVAGVALLCWFPIALWRGAYRSIIRFSGGRTMTGLAVTVAIFTIPMVMMFMINPVPGVPRTIALLHPIVFLALLAVSRLAIRFILIDVVNVHRADGLRRSVAIYGAGGAGQQLALALRHEPNMRVEAFIDDDERLTGQRLDGVVVHSPANLGRLLDDGQIHEVLLALPSAPRSRRKLIIESLQNYPVMVRSLPSVGHVIDGKVSVSDLRNVSIDDLLGRDPVQPNELLLGRTTVGKTVLVSGAGGSIGSELCRQIIRSRPSRLVLLEQSEYSLYSIDLELRELAAALDVAVEIYPVLADVTDTAAVDRVFAEWRPATVFHAAAYKHVPLVEVNPMSGLRNNVFGTLSACRAAERHGVGTFILISTDKAVRPTNVMGASKRICELILQARAKLATEEGRKAPVFAMVRFGNVLGSSGSVVPRFQRQIKEGGPVTLTHRDVTRYFMTIPEAAQLVIQAGALSKGGEVFVLDMGQPVRIIDLARSMIQLSGMSIRDEAHPEGDIEICEIGLRKGEKLYEELLIGDNPEPTIHERIMKANEIMLDWSELGPRLDVMEAIIARNDVDAAMSLLQELVSGYSAQHRASS